MRLMSLFSIIAWTSIGIRLNISDSHGTQQIQRAVLLQIRILLAEAFPKQFYLIKFRQPVQNFLKNLKAVQTMDDSA